MSVKCRSNVGQMSVKCRFERHLGPKCRSNVGRAPGGPLGVPGVFFWDFCGPEASNPPKPHIVGEMSVKCRFEHMSAPSVGQVSVGAPGGPLGGFGGSWRPAKPRLTRQSRVVAEGRSEGIPPRATTRRTHHCSATLCIRRQAMLVGPPRPQEAC